MTRSHKRTSMGPSRSCWNGTTSALQPEEITSKETRVSCVYISIKVPIRKKSGNLFNDPRIQNVSLSFYQTCLNERLSNYTKIHTHTHTHIYIYCHYYYILYIYIYIIIIIIIYIYIYIYIYIVAISAFASLFVFELRSRWPLNGCM